MEAPEQLKRVRESSVRTRELVVMLPVFAPMDTTLTHSKPRPRISSLLPCSARRHALVDHHLSLEVPVGFTASALLVAEDQDGRCGEGT